MAKINKIGMIFVMLLLFISGPLFSLAQEGTTTVSNDNSENDSYLSSASQNVDKIVNIEPGFSRTLTRIKEESTEISEGVTSVRTTNGNNWYSLTFKLLSLPNDTGDYKLEAKYFSKNGTLLSTINFTANFYVFGDSPFIYGDWSGWANFLVSYNWSKDFDDYQIDAFEKGDLFVIKLRINKTRIYETNSNHSTIFEVHGILTLNYDKPTQSLVYYSSYVEEKVTWVDFNETSSVLYLSTSELKDISYDFESATDGKQAFLPSFLLLTALFSVLVTTIVLRKIR